MRVTIRNLKHRLQERHESIPLSNSRVQDLVAELQDEILVVVQDAAGIVLSDSAVRELDVYVHNQLIESIQQAFVNATSLAQELE